MRHGSQTKCKWTKSKLRVLTTLRASAKEETLLRKENGVHDAKNVFGIFCCQDADSMFSAYVVLGRKRGSIWETLKKKMTSNVFQLFPRLRTQGTYFEDAEFASWKQKMFCFLLVCSLLQQYEQHWLQMFLQQCFLVCTGLKRTQLNMNDFHLNS